MAKMEEWIRVHRIEKADRKDEHDRKRRERDPNYDPHEEDFDKPPIREYDAKVAGHRCSVYPVLCYR